MPNVVVLDAARCTGCGICVRTCPEMVFAPGDRPRAPVEIAHPDRCLGCLACDEDCPEGALRVHRLPADMALADVPPPGAGLDDRVHDLVVVGAGPAGLGAAIAGRALGLDVAVIERMPSMRRAHHPDGGLLTGQRGDVTQGLRGLHLPDLDVTVPRDRVRETLRRAFLMGPDGRTTRSGAPVASMAAVDKDDFVRILAERALDAGARIAWNTRAQAVERDTGDGPVRVRVDGGRGVAGRVAICAEGITGRLAAAAGAPVNEDVAGWSFGAMFEHGPLDAPRDEMGFALGAPDGFPEGVGALSYWSSGTARTEFMSGTVQRARHRVGDVRVTDLVRMAAGEARFADRIGDFGASTATPDGCRILARRLPKSAVADRLIAPGDALTCCGMLTSVTSARTGALAARVAAAAIARGDVSAAGLRDFDRRAFAMPQVKGMKFLHNLLIEAPMALGRTDLDALMGILAPLDLGRMMAGGPGALWALVTFMFRSGRAMGRRPDLARYVKG